MSDDEYRRLHVRPTMRRACNLAGGVVLFSVAVMAVAAAVVVGAVIGACTQARDI